MLQVLSPNDLSLIKEIPLAGKVDVEKALVTAYDLFKDQGRWITPHERIAILGRVAEIMKDRIDELTYVTAQEGNKSLGDSRVEVIRAINIVKLAVEHIEQSKGKQIPIGLTKDSGNIFDFTTREPIGVMGSLSALDHSLNLIFHQVVTAVAVGCPVIVKPSLTTPLSCVNLANILCEAGLPEGWCQVVVCDDEAAAFLATDKRVNYFLFSGSEKIGWELKSRLENGLKCA